MAAVFLGVAGCLVPKTPDPGKTILLILGFQGLTVPTERLYNYENSARDARHIVRRIAMIPTEEISKITLAPIAKSQESSSAAGERRVELAVLALAASSVPGRACADQKNEYFTKNPENKLAKLAASLRGSTSASSP